MDPSSAISPPNPQLHPFDSQTSSLLHTTQSASALAIVKKATSAAADLSHPGALNGAIAASVQELWQHVSRPVDAHTYALQALNNAVDIVRGDLDEQGQFLRGRLETLAERGDQLSNTDLLQLARIAEGALENNEQQLIEMLGND